MYVAAVLLAVTFGVSGALKLRDPRHTTRVFRDFGVPAPRVSARVLPVVELAVAVALVALPRIGGLAATALLVGFTVAIVDRLRRGERASCGCFGTWSRRPLSRLDVLRNAVLLALAVAATYAPSPVT